MGRVYLVFRSTYETLKAEEELLAAGIRGKLVTQPAAIKVDCGLALRVNSVDRVRAVDIADAASLVMRGVWEL